MIDILNHNQRTRIARIELGNMQERPAASDFMTAIVATRTHKPSQG